MATPVYPSSLPGVANILWAPTEKVIASDQGAVGPLAIRNNFHNQDATVKVSWRFLEEDFAIFQEFYKTDLIRGHRWFAIKLPSHKGFSYFLARFLTHRTSARDGYSYRTVSAEMYVQDLVSLEDFALRFTTTPYPIEVIDEVDTTITLIGGNFREIPTPRDDIDMSIIVTGGKFTQLLLSYVIPVEAVDMDIDLTAGDLRTVLLSTSVGPDSVDLAILLTSGTLRVVLLNIPMVPEGIDISIEITGGTLT